MHIQKLQETGSDKLRNQRTVSLTFGDRAGRWSVAVPILECAALCPLYLRAGLSGLLASVLPVAVQALWMGGILVDRWSWQMWDLWLILILPA